MTAEASMDYRAPSTVEEVLALRAQHGDDATLLAGGTSVVLLMKNRLVEPSLLVDLRKVAVLREMSLADGGIMIGAGVTLREVEQSPLVRAHAAVLADATAYVATVRIRNQATLGGCIVHADPASDPPPALIVLDAVAILAGPNGRREVPLDGFFTDVFETALAEDELMLGIRIPALPAGARTVYLPFQPRTVDDYATVAVAARLDIVDGHIAGARLGLGAVGPVPLRATAAEAVLVGLPADAADPTTSAAIERAAELAVEASDPTDDVRGTADYKRAMLAVHVRRALRGLLDGSTAEATR